MIETLQIFSPAECTQIRTTVYELRNLWMPREHELPLYTLSAASYIDAARSFSFYCELAASHNPVLKQNFGWIYERLGEALSQHLQAPVSYSEQYALPGFHVFLMHPLFRQPVASVHCDLQYRLLDWGPAEAVDWTRPLSFTISISLPPSGAGLNVWDLEHNEWKNMSHMERQYATKAATRVFVPYETGKLVLHSGHQVHQIAPMTNAEAEDERITLQGHAILRENVWQVYW